MTKTIFIVGLLLLLVSCNAKNDECQGPSKASDPTALSEDAEPNTANCPNPESPIEEPVEDQPEDIDEDVPFEASQFGADVDLTKFDPTDEAKLLKAVSIIKKIIRSKEFKERVLNFTYNGKKEFLNNEGLSNAEIYQKLLDGDEELKPEIDHEMDLELELYYSNNNTVGYTYPNVLQIWMNTKYFDAYTPSEVAGNVFHEWTHKLGFSHASSYSVARKSSVPYALGYLMEELGKQYE